jgi:serine/threonine protein kinase
VAGYLHRDIKPDNFRIHCGKVRITDFGLLNLQVNKSVSTFLGTPYYASLAAHDIRAQGFKDELESLAYNILYLIVGEGGLWFN